MPDIEPPTERYMADATNSAAQAQRISSYLEDVRRIIAELPQDAISQIADVIYGAYQRGRYVFAFGNGGSSACASHFIEDVAKGIDYGADRPRYRALALTDSVPLITAWANDTAYENVFAEQLRNFVEPGDVAIGISASGNSPNVLRAVELAKEVGASTVGLTGYDGGKLAKLAHRAIVVRSDNMQKIEDVHLVICHLLYVCLRDREG
jgi:D-sedoheptulose 7-phosphate isomerase